MGASKLRLVIGNLSLAALFLLASLSLTCVVLGIVSFFRMIEYHLPAVGPPFIQHLQGPGPEGRFVEMEQGYALRIENGVFLRFWSVMYAGKRNRLTVNLPIPYGNDQLRFFLLAPRILPKDNRFPAATSRFFSVPLYLPALFFGAAAWWSFRRFVTIPRDGHCGKCGYNLTTNISGTCPECGSPIP